MSWIICPDEKNGFLDLYPGAAAAYSLRNLNGRSGLLSSVVRVRRSSDDVEQDFTAAQITDGTLTTFCSAGDGFVRTWYDQSGNGNNATQTNTAAQPRCVSSGSLEQDNGNPAFLFDGTDDRLDLPVISSVTGTNPRYFATVTNASDLTESSILVWDTSDPGRAVSMAAFNTQINFRFTGGAQTIGTISPNDQNLISWSLPEPANNANLSSAGFNGSYANLTLNRSLLGTVTSPAFIGGDYQSLGTFFAGKMQEIILYPSAQANNRAAIEANINAHYSIF